MPHSQIASHFNHVLLIGKYQAHPAKQVAESRLAILAVADCLEKLGCEVSLELQCALGLGVEHFPTQDITAQPVCDVAVVVGGDGTMLWAARHMARARTPLIGINQGRLGFITDLALDSFQITLAQMLQGQYEPESRCILQAQVWRDDAVVFDSIAMNDVVVNRGATSGMVDLSIRVNGHFVASQRADGLIVATPTGSTAYALSAGGSLLHPSLAGWILVPIAPHKLSNRPIVLPDTSVIEIEVLSGRDASANFDMQALATLVQGDRVVVQRAPNSALFLHPKGWHYYDTLRQKLHWNEG